MAEAERFGVEHDPWNSNIVKRHDLATAIRDVSKDGVAQRGEVDTNLVSPARERQECQPGGDLREALNDAIAGGRLLGPRGAGGEFLAFSNVASDGEPDLAVGLFRDPPTERF